MRLGLFLALVATTTALQCNVGNLIVENGIITAKTLEQKYCEGTCSRSSLETVDRTIVVMGCEENEVANFVHEHEGKTSCSATELEGQCFCSEELCNEFKAEEQLAEQTQELASTGSKCYVGYYASNGTGSVSAGDTVMCGPNMACASINATVSGYEVEAYFCTPTALCANLFGQAAGCGAVKGDVGGASGCCCTAADCTYLPTQNPNIVVPTAVTSDKAAVQCYNGAQLDYTLISGGSNQTCYGSCGSVSIQTTFNGNKHVLDLFTCDPVELCSAVNLNNQCGNIALSGQNSLIRGCCCNSDNCINPNTKPPTYPQKQLKCYTGLFVPSTNQSMGAEMMCQGQCGRMEVPINGVTVKYMMCAPYATCQGLGIAQADQCYNPPLEEETKLCCCSSSDNCNIAAADLPVIKPNITFLPTTNYPILCYAGIYLNGKPITTGSYQMCSGECATASFVTTAFGQQHNTTLYTCDPVSMCKSAGISNGCSQLTAGVTGCCCDTDSCFDPIRKPFQNMTCFTGIYVAPDNKLIGGEMQCDGWCASLSTVVNGKNSTTYWCAPVQTCRHLGLGMGGPNNCNTISGTSNTLTGCCCSDKANCNLPAALRPNVTAIPARYEAPIVCYEAIRINNKVLGRDRYRVCDGECVSMRMGDVLANGTVVTTDLYTCDSSSACGAMGLRNGCGSVDGTVRTCCCDTDACIDPTVNRSPDQQLMCYVGIQTTYQGQAISVGAELACNGKCANITTTANGTPFTSYHCMPTATCRALSLDNSCNSIQLDRALNGCCCDSSNSCNAGKGINTTMPISPPEAPIACYNGIQANGVFTAGSGWQTCQGDCMSISINTTVSGTPYSGTIYSCDPTSICSGLNITNRCHNIEPGVQGCCCSDSGCIDPTKTPPKVPSGRPMSCLVGIMSSYNNMTAVAPAQCSGRCASLSTTIAGANVTAFACVPQQICSTLSLYDDCATIPGDRSITGCCCNNVDNCNGIPYNAPTNGHPHSRHDFPIACYQGLTINHQFVGNGQWSACMGDCASVSLSTVYNRMPYTATLYTCDPANVCHQLGLTNNCSLVEPGVSGCCCETDACLDPTKSPRKVPGNPLKCYVGVKSYAGLNVGIDVGSEVICNGKCGYVHGLSGNYNVTAYLCVPSNICSSLELNDGQRQLPGDRKLTASCCDNYSNCNVYDPTINTTKPIPSNIEYPITCYQGIFVNGQAIVPGGFQTCNGDCAMLTLNTTYNGATASAQLYTCDPTAVCQQLGVMNNCSTIEAGLGGCCCNTNGCLDPTKFPAKVPGKQLQCFVGVRSTYQNLLSGSSVNCNGKCASLSGTVGGQNVTTYHCVNSAICRTLELDDSCTTIQGDRSLTGCCCDNANFCSTKNDTSIKPAAPSPMIEYPITCWSGLYVNGNVVATAGWQACNGDCASVSINTTYNGAAVTGSLYTCDPSSVCTQLNTLNTCQTLEPGVQACCCNSDGCIDPVKGRNPANPLMCYVGVKSNYNNLNVGASVPCSGKCSSLSGMVGGYNVQTFQCIATNVCKTLELYDACRTLQNDNPITACCCDNTPYCNLNNTGISPPAPVPYTEAPIACFNGVILNGKAISGTKYMSCNGKCASVSLTTMVGNSNMTASIYTCDPSSVCNSLGLSNQCQTIESGFTGCCCDSDACLDPLKGKTNLNPLVCYVGLYAAYNNYSIGADVTCNGKCASLNTTYNGQMVKSYHCAPTQMCENLGLANSCNTVGKDTQVTGCCCDSSSHCNVGSEVVAQNLPPVTNWTGAPIACWSGVSVNGIWLGTPGYASCRGDCAVMQMNTTVSGMSASLAYFTCDPVSVCRGLGVINSCGTVDRLPGLTGCCCSTDACLDGTSIYPKGDPSNPLMCYVGVKSTYNNLTVGSAMPCNGYCSSVSGIVAGQNVQTFQCIDSGVCNSLSLYNTCASLPGDRQLSACCCNSGNYCNIAGKNIPTPVPSTSTEAPIACFSGVMLNGKAITTTSYSACQGKCASVNINTVYQNVSYAASIYTCDPSTVCDSIGLYNQCKTVEPGVSGCCCDSDACLDPLKGKTNLNPLVCYVGLYAGYNNYSIGADVTCNGKCASLNTTYNGQMVKSYHCAPAQMCESLELYNSCKTVGKDTQVTGCCCDSSSHCNVGSEIVAQNLPPVTNWTGAPIACWSGVSVNGVWLGNPGYASCRGDCAVMQMNTTVMNVSASLAYFTCDPVSVCRGLGVQNTCGTVDRLPGLTGCCCSTDACLDGTSIYPKGDPSNPLMCYVGVKSTYQNLTVGSAMPCNGYCSSVSGIVAGQTVQTFQCVDSSVCNSLSLYNTCGSLPGDRQLSACCCNNGNYCNIAGMPIMTPTPSTSMETPIACFSGVMLNGKAITTTGYTTCQGKCASVNINTVYQNVSYAASIYTCDPSTVCDSIGLYNQCKTVEPGVSGCCCDSDACLDPLKGKTNLGSRMCYVGVYAAYNNYTVGSDVICSGKCASLQTTVNGTMVKTYHCVQNQICEDLEVYNSCKTVGTDTAVTGCCCDSGDNCNVGSELDVTKIAPASNNTVAPTMCYSGIFLNGQKIGQAGPSVCYGDCASIQLNGTIANKQQSLSLYTCDPVSVCNSLKLNNQCGTIDGLNGVTGCCCNADRCLDGTSIYPNNLPTQTGSGASMSIVLLLTAVYMMIRQ